MSLSSISIRRPVLAVVMSLVILLFGIISLSNLGIREYPSVDAPIVTVTTSLVGANADIIETQITEPLEESINGIAGIRTLTSVSRDGRSTISVEFEVSIDLETAANDVRDRVARAVGQLPPDVDPPVVAKADADANPIVFVGIGSKTRDLLSITDIANNIFKERLQTIPGVSRVQIWGEKKYSMRLRMDPKKLASYGLTPMDIRAALTADNIELPSGRIEGSNTELTVRTLGRLSTVEEFNNLILKETGGGVVRFKDVGFAELGPENERTVLKRDGVPMVGVVLVPQPGSNHIQIADDYYKRVEEIKRDLPADVEVEYGYDTTTFIRESITEVEQTIYVAFLLVLLVIFFFLRDWRTTLIPIIAIPISLIGTFFIMYIANFSINVLTLLGIVLAIGIVVDDAIVVLENIYRKIEEGRTPMAAAHEGASEIFFAIISTTVSLAAIFLPIIFLKGLTGKLFLEFGVVIAGSIIISAFVALTLTPMLSARFLKPAGKHNKFYEKTEPFFARLSDRYESSLRKFLKKRWLALPILFASFALIYIFGGMLPSELAPMEDRSAMRITSTTPEGTSFDAMDAYMNIIVAYLKEKVPEAQQLVSITAPGFGASSTTNTGFVRLMLVSPDERQRSQQQIAAMLTKELAQYNDARTVIIQEPTISGRQGGLPIQYVLQAQSFEKLREVVPAFLNEARSNPTFQVVDINLKFNKPEAVIEIDRTKARELGITVSSIAQMLQLGYSGQRFGYFIMNGKQYQVIGDMLKEFRMKPADLKALYIRSSDGKLVQLDNVVSIREQSNPPQLFRYNRYVSATISASLAPGKTIGDGIAAMDAIKDKVLDESFTTALAGESKDFVESSSSLVFTFLFALVLMYLVLAAQFESFRDPFIIMFTVPLALGGALFALWYFSQTLNIFSQIGQIMLIGLVTKNGILIVEFANQKKIEGLNVHEAVTASSVQRFRPILMTSLSTVLGTLPIALALGAGSESRVSMGIAIIGGLLFSTFLSLYIVPAMYTFLTSRKASSNEEEETSGVEQPKPSVESKLEQA